MNVIKMTIVIGILGCLSSGIGGIISNLFNFKSNNKIAALYELTAGIMTSIVCLDMLPECFELSSIWYSIIGIIIGVSVIFVINKNVEGKEMFGNNDIKNKPELKSSYIVAISMAIHNMIEGIAIGTGFSLSFSLGMSILISIFLHDIPEGIVVGIVNKTSNKSNFKNIVSSVFVGGSVCIGAFIGGIFGNISDNIVSILLSIAAGAMLYIVSCDLIPYSKKISQKKEVSLMYIIGIVIGAIITNV